MTAVATILSLLYTIPLIRRLWRWLLERHMEIEVKDHKPVIGKTYVVQPPHFVDGVQIGTVYALVDLYLTNHHPDRTERVVGCWAELRTRRWLLWKRTLATIDVGVPDPGDPARHTPITDILIRPVSAPRKVTIQILGNIRDFTMPRRSELVLILKMVGPIRRLEHQLTRVTHDPNSLQPDGTSDPDA